MMIFCYLCPPGLYFNTLKSTRLMEEIWKTLQQSWQPLPKRRFSLFISEAPLLVRALLLQGSTDNITIIVVLLKPIKELICPPLVPEEVK